MAMCNVAQLNITLEDQYKFVLSNKQAWRVLHAYIQGNGIRIQNSLFVSTAQWHNKGWGGGVWGVQTPPPEIQKASKIVPNSTPL
jgi:hypothetical protein